MLVVIGSPAGRLAGAGLRAAGLAAEIAASAASQGGAVQIVGRVGDDPTGDAVLLDLAAAGVGHVAVLRVGGEATPIAPAVEDAADPDDDSRSAARAMVDEAAAAQPAVAGLPLDAADLDLALRYLPDYRVIVLIPGLDGPAVDAVTAAAGWSGARLVVVVDGDAPPPALPPDATVLAQPPDENPAFAMVVARYAVALDRGEDPGRAFTRATGDAGWEPVEG